ncbi:MAG: phasin family protein [Candidatus Binatia bacterium]|jgi:BMFP domain-containing protein YqiC
MTAKSTRAESWSTAMPKRLSELQRTAQKHIRKQWQETVDMLPPVPRKALKRLTANVDRARRDLRKSGERVVADARKRAQRLTGDVQKRLESTIEPLITRLDVASRKDIERLQRRLHDLERRVQSQHSSLSA